MIVGAAGAVDHEQVVGDAAGGSPARRAGAPAAGAARIPRRHAVGRARSRAGAPGARRSRACSVHRPGSTRCRSSPTVLGGGMSSRLFQEVREKRGLCYTISAFHMPFADTGVFALYAGTDAADAAELMRVVIDELAEATETLSDSGGRARQGAAQGRAAHRARKPAGPRGPVRASAAGLWAPDSARGDRRQDRRGDRRERARGRPRAGRGAAGRRLRRSARRRS